MLLLGYLKQHCAKSPKAKWNFTGCSWYLGHKMEESVLLNA